MSIFSRRAAEPFYVKIGSRPLVCMFCEGDRFWYRPIQMNTAAMEMINLGWTERSSHGLICAACGYVHEFMGDNVHVFQRAAE